MSRWILIAALVSASCAERVNQEAAEIEDPISDVPVTQQLTIMRRAIEQHWPLTVGKGTLGCRNGAVVFRAGGTTYGVNDVARGQGFSSIDAIHAPAPSPPPKNPLKERTQDERMRIFAELGTCAFPTGSQNVATECTRQIGTRHRLTEAELGQIRDEGIERSWPPLRRKKADLQPFIERGLKLCRA